MNSSFVHIPTHTRPHITNMTYKECMTVHDITSSRRVKRGEKEGGSKKLRTELVCNFCHVRVLID